MPIDLGSREMQGSVRLNADAINCRKERRSLLFKRLIAEMLLRTTLQKGHFVTEFGRLQQAVDAWPASESDFLNAFLGVGSLFWGSASIRHVQHLRRKPRRIRSRSGSVNFNISAASARTR